MLAAQLGRDLGKQKEPELWLAWGGKPTTQLMRHRDRQLDAITKQRYHNKIAHLIPITIPTPDVEMAEPGIADDTYDSCVIWLISRTRSTSNYPLLFKENVNYGFRRNL
ncbi:MAG: hypothetical protein C0485_05090 [Pirellula sp.]|nr:hypothetical protein [Pirellula sp.]